MCSKCENRILKMISDLSWQPFDSIMRKKLPITAWDWLTYSKSLTVRLQQFTQNRIVFCLIQDWVLNPEKIWARKTQWQFEKQRWIKANLFFPDNAINHENQFILYIHEKPIGEILFQDPQLTRSKFLFYQHATFLWSRKSIFHFKQKPLTLIETFYPIFFESILA